MMVFSKHLLCAYFIFIKPHLNNFRLIDSTTQNSMTFPPSTQPFYVSETILLVNLTLLNFCISKIKCKTGFINCSSAGIFVVSRLFPHFQSTNGFPAVSITLQHFQRASSIFRRFPINPRIKNRHPLLSNRRWRRYTI